MVKNKGASYIAPSRMRVSQRPQKFLALLLSFFVLLSVGASGVATMIYSDGLVARADYNDDFRESGREYGVGGDQEAFEETITQAFDEDDAEEADRNTFGYVIRRIFSTEYMNNVEYGVPASGYPDRDFLCDTNATGAGTVVYHNCDIPNITTDFLQGIVSLVAPTGMQGAQVQSAVVPLGFGLPSTIPNGVVPVDASERSVKYTALELFGYNLRYTSYMGEWDQIKVMNSARALSNFGIIDSLHLGITAVINGITAGMEGGIQGFIDGWKDGGPIAAIWGGIKGQFEGSSSAVLNTVLDTSDMNVANLYAWYRAGFGKTLYNGREISQVELQRNLTLMIASYISSKLPGEATFPEDYLAIQEPPERPQDAISECLIVTVVDGKLIQTPAGVTSEPPGPTRDECQGYADAQAEDGKGSILWDEDGTQEHQTLPEWGVANQWFLDTAARYSIDCTIDTSSDENREQKIHDFYNCWEDAYQAVEEDVLLSERTDVAQEWYDDLMSYDTIMEYMNENPAMNANAPWNRFICQDANGNDVYLPDAKFLEKPLQILKPAYDHNGNLNDGCMPLRPPIQNGFFGNGYLPGLADNQSPGVDTRYALVDRMSLANLFFSPQEMGTSIANTGLVISQFVTKTANTLLDFAFSPVLDKLGLKTKIEGFIENFRDSLFFPLIGLMVALSGLQILFKFARSKQYTEGMKSALLMVVTIFVGTMTLFRPDIVLDAVDEGPAYVETAIVGTIFGVGREEGQLCSATQSTSDTLIGIEGEELPFNPRSSVRTMTCEVWRIWVFNPWVAGQWGTSYEDLYAATTNEPSKFQNTNTNLVGNAAVRMGGGVTVNNWALYQLQTMTSGTSTTKDRSKTVGSYPADIYRVVDAQAGPNGGAASDGRFLEAWSGQNPLPRMAIAIVSVPSSILGLIAIMAFAVSKLIVTFVSLVMLLILPFMLLIGVQPTSGRMQLKAYVGTILSLMYQRIILVSLLAVMMKIMIGFAGSGNAPLATIVMTLVLSAVFLFYRKKALELAHASTTRVMGQSFTSQFAQDPQRGVSSMLPRTAQNRMNQQREGLKGAVGGAIGGFVSGGTGSIVSGAKEQYDVYARKSFVRDRRKYGLGAVGSIADAAGAARRDAQADKRKQKGGSSENFRGKVEGDITNKGKELLAEEKANKARLREEQRAEVEKNPWAPAPKGEDADKWYKRFQEDEATPEGDKPEEEPKDDNDRATDEAVEGTNEKAPAVKLEDQEVDVAKFVSADKSGRTRKDIKRMEELQQEISNLRAKKYHYTPDGTKPKKGKELTEVTRQVRDLKRAKAKDQKLIQEKIEAYEAIKQDVAERYYTEEGKRKHKSMKEDLARMREELRLSAEAAFAKRDDNEFVEDFEASLERKRRTIVTREENERGEY